MKFVNGQLVKIHSTNSKLDGITATVVGVSASFTTGECNYIIHGVDEMSFDYLGCLWDSMQITEHCLMAFE